MSASTMAHGPFTASARRIEPGEFAKDPFVSLDIHTPGASVSLVDIDLTGLTSLASAIEAALALLPEPVA